MAPAEAAPESGCVASRRTPVRANIICQVQLVPNYPQSSDPLALAVSLSVPSTRFLQRGFLVAVFSVEHRDLRSKSARRWTWTLATPRGAVS